MAKTVIFDPKVFVKTMSDRNSNSKRLMHEDIFFCQKKLSLESVRL